VPKKTQQQFIRSDLIAVDQCTNKDDNFGVAKWILHNGELLLLVGLDIHTGGRRADIVRGVWLLLSMQALV